MCSRPPAGDDTMRMNDGRSSARGHARTASFVCSTRIRSTSVRQFIRSTHELAEAGRVDADAPSLFVAASHWAETARSDLAEHCRNSRIDGLSTSVRG